MLAHGVEGAGRAGRGSAIGPGGDDRRQRHDPGRPDRGAARPALHREAIRGRHAGGAVGAERQPAVAVGAPHPRGSARRPLGPAPGVRDRCGGLQRGVGGGRVGPRLSAPVGRPGRPGGGRRSDAAGERGHRQQHLPECRAREGARHDGRGRRDRRRPRPDHRRSADLGVQLAPGAAGQRAPGHRVPGGHPVGRAQGSTSARAASRVDLLGAGLLCLSIVSLVFGLTEAQSASLASLSVLGPVAVALVSGRRVPVVGATGGRPADGRGPPAPDPELPRRHDQPGPGRLRGDGPRADLPARSSSSTSG